MNDIISNYAFDTDNNIFKKDKPKIRKRKKDNNIEGQISLFDNNY